MGLLATIQLRVPTTRLAALCDFDDNSPTSVNTTALQTAIDQFALDFRRVCAIDFDDNDTAHIAVGVRAVLLWLYVVTTEDPDKSLEYEERYLKTLQQYALVSGRDRLTPTSNSDHTPDAQQAGPLTFDRGDFDGIL